MNAEQAKNNIRDLQLIVDTLERDIDDIQISLKNNPGTLDRDLSNLQQTITKLSMEFRSEELSELGENPDFIGQLGRLDECMASINKIKQELQEKSAKTVESTPPQKRTPSLVR